MEIYILKSAACMAIFLLFYKLLLEQESMHVFKRYFLLGAVAASFIVPAIVLLEYTVPRIYPEQTTLGSNIITSSQISHIPTDLEVINWSTLLWTIYFVGLLGFGLRFAKHLIQIIKRIKINPKLKTPYNIKVLLKEKLPPHTFFSYIFLNKNKFEANAIPKAVLIHEEIHAQQYHSFDVLLIELVQVIFWFNPLVYLFKKSIKLNHEFLADSAVLKSGLEKSAYQKLLLAFSSNAAEPKLANAITYSSIKKRFKVMKKRTSKQSIVFRSVLLLPLVTLLLVGFSERKFVENQKADPIVNHTVFSTEPIEIRIDAEGTLFLGHEKVGNLQLLEKELFNFNKNFSKEQREQRVKAVINVEGNTPKELIEELDQILMRYGVATINILGPEPGYTGAQIETVTEQSQTEKYNSLAKKYNAIPIEKRVIPLQDLKVLETIYRKMSKTERKKAQPFPECLPKTTQDGATRQQMKEYDALAKTYNNMLKKRGSIRILKADVDRLEYLYSLMSEKQRDDAEPFPDFPEPPPAPEAPEPPNEREVAVNMIKEIIEEQDPYDVVGGSLRTTKPSLLELELRQQQKLMRQEEAKMEQQEKWLQAEESQLREQQRTLEKQENVLRLKETQLRKSKEKAMEKEVELREKEMNLLTPTPPAPPTPPSPLDYAIEMSKKGASFMYENKIISADEAIALLKKNRELNMESNRKNGNILIKISKEPVTRN